MRIVFHAGLHKTGTSTVQASWEQWFPFGGGPVWYPRPADHGPGHAAVAWWAQDRDDIPLTQPLPLLVDEAHAAGVETLLFSSEEFDRCRPEHADRLKAAVKGHDLTLLLTMTPPRWRWPSAWQELVKHGHEHDQLESRDAVASFMCADSDTLSRLCETFGAHQTYVRLLRADPFESDLAAQLLRVVGLNVDLARADDIALNVSIGHEEAMLLCVLNRLQPGGIGKPAGTALIDALKNHAGWREAVPFRRVELVPEMAAEVHSLAQRERRELQRLQASGLIRLDDPHNLLEQWADVSERPATRRIPERPVALGADLEQLTWVP